MNLRTTVGLCVALLTLIIVTVSMLSLPASVLIVIGAAIAAILIFSLIGLVFWLVLLAHIKYEERWHQSRLITTPHGDYLFRHHKLNVVPLSKSPLLQVNGTERSLTQDEIFIETVRNKLSHNRAGDAVGLLPAGQPVEAQLDLLTIFTQPTQSYAIIGGQQVGKTYQARRIAAHWQQAGLKPIVIGPKWDRDEWTGCELFGGEYNFERVAQGMRIIGKLAQDRHANRDLGHKQHPIQPVFFDDWTAIRVKLESEAEAFILDATTLYASVNIILYFIIHLDTANAWGVGRVGAALHQNFIKLFIKPGFDSSGLIDRSKNKGYVLFPGMAMKDRKPVLLFSGTGRTLLLPDLVLEPSVSNRESKIISLIQAGATDKQIAQEVFDKPYLSGDNFYKVKKLREDFS